MSVILPPTPQTMAGLTTRHGPLGPAPLHAASMAGPVATTQLKQAVRPVEGLSKVNGAEFVPAQNRKERPEPDDLLGPRPSFAANLLDALPEELYPDPRADADAASSPLDVELMPTDDASQALLSGMEALQPEYAGQLDLRV